jgi:hypothetical protein
VNIWESETIPSDENKSQIVKVPKKGGLQCCDRWRGITLLSVLSKVFYKMNLGRLTEPISRWKMWKNYIPLGKGITTNSDHKSVLIKYRFGRLGKHGPLNKSEMGSGAQEE